MGMTTGTVTHDGVPAAGVTIQFKKSGVLVCNATTNDSGVYAAYLAAGTYSAYKMPEAIQCSPATFNIPSGTKIQNLSY
jgi:hypothetical protein